jgi:hypothetical protein
MPLTAGLTTTVNKLIFVPNDRLSLMLPNLPCVIIWNVLVKRTVLFDELMIVNLNAKLLVTTNPIGERTLFRKLVIKNLQGRTSPGLLNPAPF